MRDLVRGLVLTSLISLLPRALGAVECVPGTYWHKHGSVDCATSTCTTDPSQATCCCSCHANYYCPGGAKTQPEDACPAGSTSPPMSTSAANCTGGPPPPAGGFEQIHVAYTGNANELSVDFVGGSGKTQVWTSLDQRVWTSAPAASFSHPTIGYMSAALLRFPGAAAGAAAYYMVGDSASNSTVFTVHPTLARPEVFAVYGDFGFANDVCLGDLVSDAAAGTFDAVGFLARTDTRTDTTAPANARPNRPPPPPTYYRHCTWATGLITWKIRGAASATPS